MHRRHHRLPATIAVAFLAVVITTAAFLTAWQAPARQPVDLTAAPAELALTDVTGQSCADRLAAGTSGLSPHAVAWLHACVEALAATPAPTSSTSTAPTASPTLIPTPTQTPSSTATPTPTVTATSNPTVTAPTGTNCLARLADCGYPHAGTTGPTAEPATVLAGNRTFSTAGQVVENVRINGCVTVNAPNIVLRSVVISGAGCFIAVRSNSTGLRLEDVEVSCGDQPGSHGISRTNVTVVRADIHSCENGLSIGPNVTVQDSWIHDLYDGGDAHTDGAQFNQDASGIVFRHNTIDVRGNSTSALIMWDEGGAQNTNVLIEGNLLAGGAYTLYCPRNNTSGVRVVGNRFGPASYGPSNSCVPGHVAEWSSNVRDATGVALPAA